VNSLKELVYKLQCYKGYYISDKEREHEKNSVLNEEGRKRRKNIWRMRCVYKARREAKRQTPPKWWGYYHQ
jgi:hypothetical protein